MLRLGTFLAILLVLAAIVVSCARAPLKGPQNAMRLASAPSGLMDDLPLEPLITAIRTEIQLIKTSPGFTQFIFGERAVTKEEYLAGLQRFADLAELAARTSSREALMNAVEKEFDFYEVYGEPDWGDIFMTSYFEPVIRGSLKRTKEHSQPLYRMPSDMLLLDLAAFDTKYVQDRKLRARLDGKSLVPYYSREQIDTSSALAKRKLEICWVDPLDAFILHIQGSGTILLPNGKRLRLGYAEKNGQKYESVGKFLRDKIPADQLNLHTIEAYLRKLPPQEMQLILNKNPSYVFFKEMNTEAVTYLGVPATAGRTIATDRRYFPKGALAFLMGSKPRFDDPKSLTPAAWQPFSRFVLDQDVGGAILGAGRVDLFWGQGEEAKRNAGLIKQPGKLYYLVPKPRNGEPVIPTSVSETS